MSDPQRLDYLFGRYYEDQLAEEEQLELSVLVKDLSDGEISSLMKKAWDERKDEGTVFTSEESHRMLSQILDRKTTPIRRMIWMRVAAASIILVLAIGGWFIFNKNATEKPTAKEQFKTDVLPGHNGAVLTLADGSQIVLDSASNGTIAQQNNVNVVKSSDGKISYQTRTTDHSPLTVYNTMTTPKGRQYSLVLPDGTQVWLNAASSITYPTAFVGKERKVSITGEAYFEVRHDAFRPFHVDVNGMDVQVLGTHFNINAYGDQGDIKTTLLQGSIKVSVGSKTQLIKPGQQAQATNDNIKLVSDADVDAVMAWKNGFFSFENTGIKEIMKQLSRWYDIEVIYQAEPKDIFTGEIDRNLTLSQVLKVLSDTKVKYRIEEGRKLIILP